MVDTATSRLSNPAGVDEEIAELATDPRQARLAQIQWAEIDRAPDQEGTVPVLVALAGALLQTGAQARSGAPLVQVLTGEHLPAGAQLGGSALVQVIADDGPHVVDTTLVTLADLGWSTSDVLHPRLQVSREPDGTLIDLEDGPQAESWQQVIATPPVGHPTEQSATELVRVLHERLAALRIVHEDTAALTQRLRAEAQTQRQSTGRDSAEAAALLDWMADGGFITLGAADHTVSDGHYTVVDGSQLGVLLPTVPDLSIDRAVRPAFDAVPTASAARDGDVIADVILPAVGPHAGALVIAKDSAVAGIHRQGLRDYVALRRTDDQGRLIGERRFVGVFSPSAHTQHLAAIPVLRQIREAALHVSGYAEGSHGAHAIEAALSAFALDELFAAPVADLLPVVLAMAQGGDRPTVRVFVRTDAWHRFAHVLVLAPRDHWTTDVRLAIHQILADTFGAEPIQFSAQVGDALLARLFCTVPIATTTQVDLPLLRRRITAATRGWADEFARLAHALPSDLRGVQFDQAYPAANTPQQALFDLQAMNSLTAVGQTRQVMYRPDLADRASLRVKVLAQGAPVSLSDAMPIWDSLGLRVLDERAFSVQLRDQEFSIVDFGLADAERFVADLADRTRILDAYTAIAQGRCDADLLNRLVTRAGLTWPEVAVLRTISRYLLQANSAYSQTYIAQTLIAQPEISSALVELFAVRFDPERFATFEERDQQTQAVQARIATLLDQVQSLDQDRIVRQFWSVINACVRTNAYQPDRPALGLKLLCQQIDWLPKPRPEFEIFVHSPRVEGVHLRFGAVARGGLRWSDRPEDFRTEVLGLVKAQMVKNTVIVPVGAKGGFLPRQLHRFTDRAEIAAEGLACYQIFIGTLLDLTDNLVDQVAVHPEHTVVHDGDDSYLVVAADRGTASFSDVANRIALERGFWLGDAFASGGSKGYDHKAMGITARGAWESVRRHLAELGIDDRADDFTVVGVGDMSGDVFGNGMLLSEHIRLVAAFNHLHVFIDPNPQASSSLAERRRLFALPRSTWADYDPGLISEGGGVWPRTAKQIPINDQIRQALGLDAQITTLTPDELIKAALQAPVDLLWNGGIGTYVKAAEQTHAEVGDKANDAVRVNGGQVRARAAGEGGNLGWTQAGRIEYSRAGGRINTDFIDNSAGVDTSDHEVNIKILLGAAQRDGLLTAEARDALLPTMTDDIASLVLRDNMNQNTALGLARKRAVSMAWVHEDLIGELEQRVGLDRELESLPSSAQMAELVATGRGLTNPELASLMAWTKIDLAVQVLASDLPDDPFVAERAVQYFPAVLQQRFADQIARHPLRREIITTIAVNRFVDSQGISAAHRLSRENDAEIPDVVRAQLAARSIFQAGQLESATVATGAAADVQDDMRLAIRKLVERGTRWLLHHRRRPLDIQAQVAAFTPPVQQLQAHLSDLLTERGKRRHDAKLAQYLAAGVAPDLAALAARAPFAHLALSMVDVSRTEHHDLELTAATFVALVETVRRDDLLAQIEALPRTSGWELQARSAMRDDLLQVQSDLTTQALAIAEQEHLVNPDAAAVVAAWMVHVPRFEQRLTQLAEATSGEPDLARISVALRIVRGFLDAVRVS